MIFLAIPNYGAVEQEVISTVIHSTRQPMNFFTRQSSMLTDNFNVLWCEMMNGKFDYFAMLHADISAEKLWIDKMIKVLEEKKIDILSAVNPIKDTSGETSTAFLPDENKKVFRLPMADMAKLPDTFDEEDVGKLYDKKGSLLVNTGLWVAKVGEWCKGFTGFKCISEIHVEEGKYKARRVSEDWLFSVDAKKLGAKICATKTIRATHIGKQGWRNYQDDGNT